MSDTKKPRVEAPSPGSKQPVEPAEFMPSEEESSEKPSENKTTPLTLDNLLSDISSSQQVNQIITGNEIAPICDEVIDISSTISQTTDTLKNINTIKDELCKLPLNPCEMDYINNSVNPLLNILYQISTASFNLASSANLLSTSSVVHPKKHELKDTVHLVYKINDECEDVYDELKRRINFVLNNPSNL
jgi:hypothetical protein